MKFLANMGISPRTVGFLRERVFGAVHLSEEGLFLMEDSAILAKAREEGFVLLTHDLDLANWWWPGAHSCPASSCFGCGICARRMSTVINKRS